ncbi:MAG TPA: DUF4184 family protein [Chitinophagaceae bacterium]|nr:DUF4184 family protein [Chitinophagaceae bacterium]
MPFTLAHPLLPVLINKAVPRLSLTAMVAGSVIPDMENFFKMRDTESTGHTPEGILLFDLPVGLLLCFLYHLILRNSFIANLPHFYRKRLDFFTDFDWTRYALANKMAVLLSLIAGICSHLFWDAFTHMDGFFVTYLPLLNVDIGLGGTVYPVHYLLQLLSSVLGLLLLFRFIRQLPQKQVLHQRPDRFYWLSFLSTLILLLTVRLIGWPDLNSYLDLWRAVMGALFYSWLIVSFIFYKRVIREERLQLK